MPNRERLKKTNPEFLDVNNNAQRVLQFFAVYYRAQNRNGAVLDAAPEFFLVKPEVLTELINDVRGSEQTWLKECVNRATSRQGYVAISKHYNSKLDYYWIDFSVMPFMLGDELGAGDNAPFFYAMDHFIAFSKKFPHVYGCLTEAANLDHDLAHMLNDIRNRARGIERLAVAYDANMLITFDPSWPLEQVNKLLASLKENRQGWCQVLFEYILHVISARAMERRTSSVTETPLLPPQVSKNSEDGANSTNIPSALMPLSGAPQQKQLVGICIANQTQRHQQQQTAPLKSETVLQERLASEREVQQQAERNFAAERALQENLQAQILSMQQQHEQRLHELTEQAEQQKTVFLEQQQATQRQFEVTLQERLAAELEIPQQAERNFAAERALQENLQAQILSMKQQHEQRLHELTEQAEQQKTALLEQQQAMFDEINCARQVAWQKTQQLVDAHQAEKLAVQQQEQAGLAAIRQQHLREMSALTSAAQRKISQLQKQNNWTRSSWKLRQLSMNVFTPRFFAVSGWGIAAIIFMGLVSTLNFTKHNTASMSVEESHSIVSASVLETPCNHAMVQSSEHIEAYFLHKGLKMSEHLKNAP